MKLIYSDYVLPNILQSGIVQQAIDFFLTRELIDLPLEEPFEDVGVYAIYYFGHHDLYRPLSKINQNATSPTSYYPIYVGKAVPKGTRTGRTQNASQSLYHRLSEHTKSIVSSDQFDISEFKCRFTIMRDNETDLIVPLESGLIRYYTPLWNSCISGFGIHHPGSGRIGQKKSEWDTLHPGRYYANTLTGMERNRDQIIQKINLYFQNRSFESDSP